MQSIYKQGNSNKCTMSDMDYYLINYTVKSNASTLLTIIVNLLTLEACVSASETDNITKQVYNENLGPPNQTGLFLFSKSN